MNGRRGDCVTTGALQFDAFSDLLRHLPPRKPEIGVPPAAAGDDLGGIWNRAVTLDEIVAGHHDTAVAEVQVEQQQVRSLTGWKADVRLGMLGPPSSDLVRVGTRVQKAVFRDRFFSARTQRKDGNSALNVPDCCLMEFRYTGH